MSDESTRVTVNCKTKGDYDSSLGLFADRIKRYLLR